MFPNNLTPYLAQEVENRQPATLQSAIDIARLYVASHPGMSTNNASLIYTASRFNNKWCAIHRFNTHDRTECRRNQSKKEN
jgi:hypothetical protein